MTSDDTDFERKATDIIGLYLHTPQHAAVFCVDEKTVTPPPPSLLDPISPPSPTEDAEQRGSQHYRHGTLSLYAAFNTRTGEALGKTASRHTTAEFVAFLTDILFNQPNGREIHVIADNLSAHKTVQVKEFLVAHCNVHLHFTPTYSSWLKQVELWLSRSEHDVIARNALSSASDLKRQLMRHIRHCTKVPKPVKWMHFDATHPITAVSTGTVH